MDLNTATIPEMTQLAEIIWLEQSESLDNKAARNSGLYRMDPIPLHTGDTKVYDEIEIEEYAKDKPEGERGVIARTAKGYSKTLTLVRRGLDAPITVEMRKRNKYPAVLARLTSLGSTTINRMDLDATHRFTYGTATSYTDMDGNVVDTTVGDGYSMFYSAHTLTASATTYRNRLANNPQISESTLEGLEKLFTEQTYNNFGEKKTMSPDTIVSSDDPNTCNTIERLMKSTSGVSDPNAGVVNVNRAKYRHVVLPRLATDANGSTDTTKAKYVMLASTKHSQAFWAIHEEPFMNSPREGGNAEDVSTEDWTYTSRAAYGLVIVSGNWIKMTSGDGAA